MPRLFPRRTFLSLLGMASTASLWRGAVRAAPAEATGWPGYRDAVVIDSLGGPGVYGSDDFAPLSAGALSDVRASGLTAVNLTVSGVGSYALDYDRTIRSLAYWRGQVAAHPEVLLEVRTAANVIAAKRSGQLGLIYGFQDTTPLGEDLERVDTFWNLGVRIFQLTYNRRNLVATAAWSRGTQASPSLGGSSRPAKCPPGVGGPVSCRRAHHPGGHRSFEAAGGHLTHWLCCRSATPSQQDRRRVAQGGRAWRLRGHLPHALPAHPRSAHGRGRPAHLQHALDVCGEDHVGVGTDGTISPVAVTPEFQKKFAEEVNERKKLGIAAPGEDANVYTFIPDLNVANRFERLAELLSARQYSRVQIAKVLGGNFLRLLREVWGA